MGHSQPLFRLILFFASSVTRLGYLLDFEQIFKVCGNNYLAHIYHILRQFKIFIFL